ncbi:phosphatidylserine decarboxylase [Nocardia gipuzkoensis]
MRTLLASATLGGIFLYWRLSYFFRDPPRQVPEGDDQIVAAADGFITYVKRVDRGEIPVAVKSRKRIPLLEYSGLGTRASGYLVGTYMTEHSVHRNRVPIAGTVVFRRHRSADPFNRSMARMTANLLLRRLPYDEGCEYLLTNERLTIGVRHARGTVVAVTQIADLWVNRIVARVGVGDAVHRGQQYGLIRFGSQCDVFLPDELVDEIRVVPGQYVLAGQTVLALVSAAVGHAPECGEVDKCSPCDR